MQSKTIKFNLLNPEDNAISWTKKYLIIEQPEMYCLLTAVETSRKGASLELNEVSPLEYANGMLEEATEKLLRDQSGNGMYIVEVIEDSSIDTEVQLKIKKAKELAQRK